MHQQITMLRAITARPKAEETVTFALRTMSVLLVASSLLVEHWAWAEDSANGGAIKIGIMADQSGPYADNGGPGSVEAAKMAIEDAGQVMGRKVELLVADDQNKPDVGLAPARKWLDEGGVDAIVGGSASSIALPI